MFSHIQYIGSCSSYLILNEGDNIPLCGFKTVDWQEGKTLKSWMKVRIRKGIAPPEYNELKSVSEKERKENRCYFLER
jgi:hypothetical protein